MKLKLNTFEMIDNTKATFVLPDVTIFTKPCFTELQPDIYTLQLFEHTKPLRVKHNHKTGVVTLENSLHKAFTGVNYNNFTLTDIVTVTDTLTDIFEVYPQNITVQSIEIGVNLTTPQPANIYLQELTTYKGKAFYYLPPPAFAVKPMQKYLKVNERVIKFYDKGKFERLRDTPNLLRYEVRFETPRTLPVEDVTFATLQTPEFYSTMQGVLTDTLNQCTRLPAVLPPDVLNLWGKDKYKKLALLTAPPAYFETVRGVSNHTYKEQRKLQRELYQDVLPYLQQTDLTPLVIAKFTELIKCKLAL